MTATTDRVVITEPGVYDIPEPDYHADPVPGGSLSSSGARKLLPPSCPARFKWEQEHGQKVTRAMEYGTVAHRLVLGDPLGDIEILPHADYRKKEAQRDRDDARDFGRVPILREEWEQVLAMADAIKAHPIASKLLDPHTGQREQSLFWHDGLNDPAMLRCRLDWLPNKPQPGRRLIVPDYKTIHRADLETCRKAIAEHGYHQQAAWNLDGITALDLAGDQPPVFVFIFQEKTAPYLITVVEPDALAMTIGADLNGQAIDLYRQCKADDHWPGYSDDVARLALPSWAEYRYYQGSPQ